MAVEKKRGCGYRKIGGIYLVGGNIGRPCDRLPFELTVCPCCSAGIKPTLGWTWIDVGQLVQGRHVLDHQKTIKDLGVVDDTPNQFCHCGMEKYEEFARKHPMKTFPITLCPFCHHPEKMGRAGLLWIGESFYKTPEEFVAEGVSQGFSRRIKTVPRGFKIGETWVLLAHRKAIRTADPVKTAVNLTPGIFFVWRPERVEMVLPESARGSEGVGVLEKKGITPVFVPDNDRDHLGTVYDKETTDA